jgi:protein TonB
MKFSIFTVILFLLLTVFSNRILAQHTHHETLLFTSVDKFPEYPGGWDALFNELNKEFKLSAVSVSQSTSESKPVFISFIVHKSGKASDFKIEQSVNTELDAKVLAAFKKFDNWIPGENDGHKVDVKMVLPFRPN